MDDLDALGLAHVVGVGLEGQTQHGHHLVVERAEGLADAFHEVRGALAIDIRHRPQELEIVAELARRVGERVDVLGEARAAVAEAGLQEGAPDARVEPHALHDLGHVRSRRLTDVGDGVDEGDLGGEEGVRGVLDDLGGGEIGDDHGPLEGGVQLDEGHGHLLGGRADHDAIGTKGVLDGGALAEELGIRHDVELHGARLVPADDFPHELARAYGHRRLVDHDLVAVHAAADLGSHRLDLGEVGLARVLGRGAHRDEDDVGVAYARAHVGGEGEAPVIHVAGDHLLETGLVDGHAAGAQGLDLVAVLVHADDVVAEVGEDRPRHESDISGADDADVHG